MGGCTVLCLSHLQNLFPPFSRWRLQCLPNPAWNSNDNGKNACGRERRWVDGRLDVSVLHSLIRLCRCLLLFTEIKSKEKKQQLILRWTVVFHLNKITKKREKKKRKRNDKVGRVWYWPWCVCSRPPWEQTTGPHSVLHLSLIHIFCALLLRFQKKRREIKYWVHSIVSRRLFDSFLCPYGNIERNFSITVF